MKALFDSVSTACSRLTTKAYSTSFSLGILCMKKSLRNPIYSIYGFVRFADEIVDTFHDYDKALLLDKFREDTFQSIELGISLNPILNSFQHTARTFQIELELIDRFLNSMQMDLNRKSYDEDGYNTYVVGSAEVVGLMCLRVFTDGNDSLYQQLKPYAMKLGSAFQKVNFLRDLNADYTVLGRVYFPRLDMRHFNDKCKKEIEENIASDFAEGFKGIRLLPRGSRSGVYVAYIYYLALFKKIRNTPSHLILKSRIRIRKRHKATLLAYSFVKDRLNLI